jgi:serine/tyrosine/threonine adenylyltransferase
MSHVDDPIYISGEYTEEQKAEVVKHGERIIEAAGEEFKSVFLQEYKELMQKVPILPFLDYPSCVVSDVADGDLQ